MPRSFSVLLADDDHDDRELFIEAISSPNIVARTVDNGEALLNFLDSCPSDALPDCIFLDLNMPIMGGKEALKQMRSGVRLQSLPVVIYSTSYNPKDVEDTFEIGANRYLVKPTSYGAMQKALNALVNLDWEQHAPQTSLENYVFAT